MHGQQSLQQPSPATSPAEARRNAVERDLIDCFAEMVGNYQMLLKRLDAIERRMSSIEQPEVEVRS